MPTEPNAPQAPLFFIPYKLMAVGDGTFLLVPAKPVAKLTIAEVARATRIHPKNLHRLIEAGIISAEQPSPKVWLVLWDEIASFLEATKQPGYWDEVKRRAFITGAPPSTSLLATPAKVARSSRGPSRDRRS
ncbi:MAG: helix-turn-helix domain-containing protein [Verrucomicrobiae bacterium]|nr:helix-turn-helix domain-containing protein [Verrucomicrobiae bacterium]